MADTWTTPATWANQQIVDEDDLNAQVRDNLTYLYNRLLPPGVTDQSFTDFCRTGVA